MSSTAEKIVFRAAKKRRETRAQHAHLCESYDQGGLTDPAERAIRCLVNERLKMWYQSHRGGPLRVRLPDGSVHAGDSPGRQGNRLLLNSGTLNVGMHLAVVPMVQLIDDSGQYVRDVLDAEIRGLLAD